MSGEIEHIREILQRSPVGELVRSAVADAEYDALEEAQNCDHTRAELRVKTNAVGSRMFGLQCLRCGRVSGKWIPRQKALEAEPNPSAWDETLSEAYWKSVQAQREEMRHRITTARNAEWWEAYNAYLASAAWKEKRRRVLDRADGLCEGCQNAPAKQVHHIDYAHVGDELLWELRAVCLACHNKAHGRAGAA